jgi:hypothetical protein
MEVSGHLHTPAVLPSFEEDPLLNRRQGELKSQSERSVRENTRDIRKLKM